MRAGRWIATGSSASRARLSGCAGSGLPPVDIIVLSRAGIAGAEPAELRAELDRLLENLK